MTRIVRVFLPILVLLGGVLACWWLLTTGPQPDKKRPEPAIPVVEVADLVPTSVTVRIPSQGEVLPVTRALLAAEVAGRIVALAPGFVDGGLFRKGEVLVTLDDRDLRNALAEARAQLAEARLALAEEEARSHRAKEEWQRLHPEESPAPLAIRQPQLEAAGARVEAAAARVRQAELDLERARITAPYDGRVLERKVGLGSFVSRGTPLADIFASDSVEVRLPLGQKDLRWLDLNRLDRNAADISPIRVDFTTDGAGRAEHWQGVLVRTEARMDSDRRQLFVVARIDQPYHPGDNRQPLHIGQFLRASIVGRTLDNVYALPRTAVRGSGEVLLVDRDNRLHRQTVEPLWSDAGHVVTAGPFPEGHRLILTPLPYAPENGQVRILGQGSGQAADGRK
ncbi:MAG: efflux RND transporter periplasmic adaptor subunit [Deltaproteobacteria bacterium]|nr:MAG: efflux RND transporter periplasmic adaptor subunit [Deltaproteobacteria bacterium]